MTSAVDQGLGGTLPSSRPPGHYRQVRQWGLHSITDLHQLRAGLRHELDADAQHSTGSPRGRVAHDLALVASELATNALRHGRAPALVELGRHDERFLLTVADHDPQTEPRIAGARLPGHGGFGLRIASSLAHDVGWCRTGVTKVVWAEIGD